MSNIYDMKLINFNTYEGDTNNYIVIMKRDENNHNARVLVKRRFGGSWSNVIQRSVYFDGDVESLVDEQLMKIARELVTIDGVKGSTMKIIKNFS